MDTRRATVVTVARFDHADRRGEQRLGFVIGQLGDADATGIGVVDDHGGTSEVGEVRGGDAAHVPAIADGEEGEEADGRVLERMEGAAEPVCLEIDGHRG